VNTTVTYRGRNGWHPVLKSTIAVATLMIGIGTAIGVVLPAQVAGAVAGIERANTAENCNPPMITSANSATAVGGTPFSFTVTTCTTAAPLIKAAHLPAGLYLVNNGNGTATVSGTPGTRDWGIYAAAITVVVIGQPLATQSLTLTVDNAPSFKSKPEVTAHTGTDFSYPITTLYGYPVPTITTASVLPTGMSLVDNGNGTGSLTGTPGPSAGGVYPITITASNGIGSPVNQVFTLTVYQAPVITSTASDTITVGVAMTPFAVTDTGYPVPTLRASGLPSGLTLTNGLIEGTPKTAGTYSATISARSKAGTVNQTLTLNVDSSVSSLGLSQPTAITEDAGNLWITNVGNNTVTVATLSGTPAGTVSGPAYGFNDPVALAGNGSDLFVVNTAGAGSVTEIDESNGSLVRVVQGSSYGFNQPCAIVLYGANAWVVNRGGNSVTEFSTATGSVIQVLTNVSNSAYHFDGPDAIGVVGSNLWVINATGGSTTDPLAGSATVIDGTSGSFVQLVNSGSDGLESPAGVAYSGGNVWISDSALSQVTELTSNGTLVQIITNSSNDANYGFNSPTVMIASATEVYVDSPPGASPMITQIDSTTAEGNWYECNTNVPDPDFDNPTGLVVTSTDVWVVSPGDNTLTELDLAENGQAVGWFH